MANRGGPRRTWRCPLRNQHGHRCRRRAMHVDVPCRAFAREWWGIPKGVRRRTRRLQAAEAS